MREAILVGIDDDSFNDFNKSISECIKLCEADGIGIKKIITQKSRKMDPNTALRSGKLDELKNISKEDDIELIIFLNNLNENILSKIKEEINAEIIDRTALILDIFSSRARSKEAMIQVEMAKIKYAMSSRIRTNTNFERSRGGGVNNRGKGENKNEIINRNIKKRLSELNKELNKIEKSKREKDNHRNKSMLKKVALVGYTNAGKSSFMNYLLKMNNKHKEVLSEDMLFATLDTSIRNISYLNYEFLLFDTVGFVSDLPHELIEAFNSTLSCAKEADLLLNIIDVSSEDFENESLVTKETLNRIGISDKSIIDIYNKVDLIDDRHRDRFEISLKTGYGIENILKEIIDTIYKKEDMKKCLIPYDKLYIIDEYKNKTDINIIEHQEGGLLVEISGLKEYLGAFKFFEVH